MRERVATAGLLDRLAAAPISWGVCEVPGWGRQLEPERVLGEMAALGVAATELGPLGWLPLDGTAVRTVLDAHGLRLVGGFVPLVLHEPELEPTRQHLAKVAADVAAAGGDVLNAAIVVDMDWAPRVALDDAAWQRLGDNYAQMAALAQSYGLELLIHPHVGTLVETADDVQRALAVTDAGWVLDTGHLLIGGYDPADFVRRHGDRIGHVHLKDVDAALAQQLRAGDRTLVQATQDGLFKPLGEGDARIDEVLRLLMESGYERWLVLEQDVAITGSEPPVDGGPVIDVRKSIEFLSNWAPRREVTHT